MADQDWQGSREDDRGVGNSAFTEQVRAALRRVEAPENFTERLMARVKAGPQTRPVVRGKTGAGRGVRLQFTRPAWRAAFAAAALLAITAGSVHMEQVRNRQRRVDQAAAQFDTALQVTQNALNHVSAKLETGAFGEVERALETDGGGTR